MCAVPLLLSGVNTAGTVTGTMEEFASGEKFRAMRGTGGQVRGQ